MARKVKEPVIDRTAPRRVQKQVEGFNYDIDVSVVSLITKLQTDLARHTEEGWTDLYLDYGYEPYDETRYIYLKGYRLETPAEVRKRIAEEDASLARKAEYERREFERLSKLFGKDS